MADESKRGEDRQDDDLAAVVAGYFDMLAADPAERPYVNLGHSKALMEQIGRTHGSGEFKHQSIPAAPDELGLPWIPGCKGEENYQSVVFDAIEYLT